MGSGHYSLAEPLNYSVVAAVDNEGFYRITVKGHYPAYSTCLKKPRQKSRGLNWCTAKGIEVWGLPVMRRNAPSTVNLHA